MIVFIRAILLYLLIIFCLRLMGKRQLGELQPSELVITILISNIASLPIEDNSIPMIMGIVPIIVLSSFELITSSISLKSKKFRTLVSGKPVIIVRNGEIDQKAMRELRFSVDDLMESLRGKSVFDIRDVQYAIVETTGQVSVFQKHDAQTVTAKMLDIKGSDADPPAVIISDGQKIRSAMDAYSITDPWLDSVLRENKIREQEIFLMTADRNHQYYIVPAASKGGAQ